MQTTALPELLSQIHAEAPRLFGHGRVASYIPALAQVPAQQFGMAVAGVDGSLDAAAVLLARVSAPDGVDAQGVALVREAVIAPSKLAWPEGITVGQKTAALTQLAERGIITRQEA
jgi:hypothetical protein